jgi:uncharacterized damage-inducible protein DinB
VETLKCLARYNAWANRRVLDTVRDVEARTLVAEAKGTLSTIEDTIKHVVGVEDAYLAMLRDQDLAAALGTQEAYYGRELAWFVVRSDELGELYQGLLDGVDEQFLASELKVPWFKTPISKRDGLLQAFGHSSQHRAQVLSALGDAGLSVPDIDYVLMLQQG